MVNRAWIASWCAGAALGAACIAPPVVTRPAAPVTPPGPSLAGGSAGGSGGGASAPPASGPGQVAGGAAPTCTGAPDISGEFADATPIEPGTIQGCVEASDDVDAYVLRVPAEPKAGTIYRVTVTTVEQADYTVEFHGFTADREELPARAYAKEGERGACWVHVAPATTLFLKAKGTLYSSSSGPTPYRIDIEAIPLEDPDEPNETPEQATPLALDAPHKAYFSRMANGPAHEVDTYRLEVPHKGTLRVRIADTPPGMWVTARLYNADREEVEIFAQRNRGAVVKGETPVAPGSYTLRVYEDTYDDISADQGDELPERLRRPYTITVSLQ